MLFRLAVIGAPCLFAVAAEPGLPAKPTECVSIATYGAKPNTEDDATPAIVQAIAAAKETPAKCVYVPPGSYRHGAFVLDGVKLVGTGESSELFGPDPDKLTIKLMGSGAGLYNLKLRTAAVERKGGHDEVVVRSAEKFCISGVTIDGSNATGIISYGGSFGRITGNRISNTKADAIHMSEGSHDLYVAGNLVRNAGDDSIAVVTYENQKVPNSHNILIENNDVGDQPWGRGVTVVGGEDVTIRNNLITKTAEAGIYLSSEKSYMTLGVKNVVVEGNQIDQCPFAHPEHGHQSVLVYSSTSYMVEEIRIANNKITKGPHGPFRISPENTSNIQCVNNTFDGGPVRDVANAKGSGPVAGASITGALLGGGAVPLPKKSDR